MPIENTFSNAMVACNRAIAHEIANAHSVHTHSAE